MLLRRLLFTRWFQLKIVSIFSSSSLCRPTDFNHIHLHLQFQLISTFRTPWWWLPTMPATSLSATPAGSTRSGDRKAAKEWPRSGCLFKRKPSNSTTSPYHHRRRQSFAVQSYSNELYLHQWQWSLRVKTTTLSLLSKTIVIVNGVDLWCHRRSRNQGPSFKQTSCRGREVKAVQIYSQIVERTTTVDPTQLKEDTGYDCYSHILMKCIFEGHSLFASQYSQLQGC